MNREVLYEQGGGAVNREVVLCEQGSGAAHRAMVL